MKIAAIIILYYPEADTLTNILSYSSYMDAVYVYDNTPAKSEILIKLNDLQKVTVYHDQENRGIAERLNQGCKKAKADGYDWVMTMDQDTFFSAASIESYFNCFINFEPKETVAAFGTSYNSTEQALMPGCIAEERRFLITSATIMNLKIWQQIEGFDEALFIDTVDQDYCIRAGLAGHKIIRFSNIYILHNIGTEVYTSSIKSLYLLRKKKFIHSPIRCYYIYRNMLYLEDKLKEKDSALAAHLRKGTEDHIRVCLYYSPERYKVRKYLKIAREDFANGDMGKIKPNRLLK